VSVNVRAERADDHTAIREIHVLAFDGKGEPEARLVELLRQTPGFVPELSLVAEQDGRVVGHILFTPLIIQSTSNPAPALALAPLAVHPEYQNQGIGSALVRHGLNACQQLGHKIVIVQGIPAYYPRFGFTSASKKGLQEPFQVPSEAFMALELVPGALDGVSGMVRYPPEFGDVY
jgi:putative acetyltransferase